MVVDTSIFAAIALAEADAQELLALLQRSENVKVSTASLVELHIVLLRRIGDLRTREADLLFAGLGLQVMPVDELQMSAARMAFTRFGKGRHAAALNFGDFSKTDVRILQQP